ncbi:hypothetical protein AURDEDRAFT_115239 [Auricularia subglabra TFB-10046 SS5]|nr:hypothetical protein AURDEDRAFT_115239 [Auricularia subglabra TFB-10046 SS5]
MPHDEPRTRPAHPPPPAQGHIRAPMLAREPTRLETLGRSVRSVISAASRRASGSQPQPRQRTRPVSFGGAITGFSPAAPTPTTTTSHDYLTVFNDDEEDDAGTPVVHDDGEDIMWAAWDTVGNTRVLLLAYASGLQLWDVSDLASIREMLNLDSMSLSLGSVIAAAVLPGYKDEEGPIIGLLTHNELMAYSLHTHRTIRRVSVPHAAGMAASAQYVAISTTQPPALHVYSTATLEAVHVVPSDQLASSTPVFALSGRLLAFTSTPPPAHVRAGRGDPPSPLSLGSTGSSPAANIASMAWRVGEGVWSGIRALASPAPMPMPAHHDRAHSERGFTSKSAPASSAVYETLRARWESVAVAGPGSPPSPTASTVRRRTSDVPSTASDGAGGFVTVLDLARLDTLAQFEAAHQSVVSLSFNEAGTVLSVAPADGGVVRLFSVARQPVHLYDLRRGYSTASIRGMTWAGDMRWVGVVTGRGTVHVFPTNPYGGKSDERSHIEGAVRNARQPTSSPTELRPLVRLRPPAPPTQPQQPQQHTSHRVAVCAMFVPAHADLPHMLRPPKGRAVQDVLVFERGQGTLSLCRVEMGLGGEGSESVVATWRLGRGREWGEVRELFAPPVAVLPPPPTGNWLAQAELSACAITLSSSIYRAHQFGFCALRDDFHALIRRAQLELPCARLEVRRAPPLGRKHHEEEEGFGDGRWAVDEAMRERLDFDAEPVLPMLPNGGVRGAQSVGAVVGRIRREVRKMRSPRLAPARQSDEDLSASASASLSTPSTRAAELAPFGEDDGWEPQDARAVEEAEMFDEICPAGIMDEELAALESLKGKQNLKGRKGE